MRPSLIKQQVVFALFFGLLLANVLYSHSVGMEFIRSARAAHAEKSHGGEGTAPMEEKQMGRGGTLVILNLPFFVALGVVVRQPVPNAGLLYWSSMILGAILVPFLITLCLYLLFHPPRPGLNLPGLEEPDEARKRWEEDDD